MKKYFVLYEDLFTKEVLYAHTKEGENNETLKEHTERAVNNFEAIYREKELGKFIDSFEHIYFDELSEKGHELVCEILLNTVVFHDFGKLNPIFQIKKMKNKYTKWDKTKNAFPDGSNHSFVSAIIYIDYFLDRIKQEEISKDEAKRLRSLVYVNSYLIAKHHSNLGEFTDFVETLREKGAEWEEQIILVLNEKFGNIYKKKLSLNKDRLMKTTNGLNSVLENNTREQRLALYTYSKLWFSMLLASDFYATSDFVSDVKVNYYGDIENINEIYDVFKGTDIYKGIREYEENGGDKVECDINKLRNDLFLEAEKKLENNLDSNIFFLEAPTGSGKSNTAFNLTFKLIEKSPEIKKIYYIYPFNTLIEQNKRSLEKVFEGNENIMDQVGIINCITPIKVDKSEIEEGDMKEYIDYEKSYLNRQFLNYPIILSTHVTLFKTMFGSRKEDVFGFHQLANSVIVLDEIQSYRNKLWIEMTEFLYMFSKLLNMKVIIMSATLPNLGQLVEDDKGMIKLIDDCNKYFQNPIFKNRVHINYDLMENTSEDDIYEHMKNMSTKKKRILVEFLYKKRAKEFYKRFLDDEGIGCQVVLMTGEDNAAERKMLIGKLEDRDVVENGILFIATQVVEAGIDIDMDIGYKDISKLDSEEQFIGRVNRSCKGEGIAYFFNLDKAEMIYKEDARLTPKFTLLDQDKREMFKEKNFNGFYEEILDSLRRTGNEQNDKNVDNFFGDCVGRLKFEKVDERMRLIDDDKRSISVFFNRSIILEDGSELCGNVVWENYKELLHNSVMNYGEKMIKISNVTSEMTYFIYEVKNTYMSYNDRVGEIYYVEDGEGYFLNGKLDDEKLFACELIL